MLCLARFGIRAAQAADFDLENAYCKHVPVYLNERCRIHFVLMDHLHNASADLLCLCKQRYLLFCKRFEPGFVSAANANLESRIAEHPATPLKQAWEYTLAYLRLKGTIQVTGKDDEYTVNPFAYAKAYDDRVMSLCMAPFYHYACRTQTPMHQVWQEVGWCVLDHSSSSFYPSLNYFAERRVYRLIRPSTSTQPQTSMQCLSPSYAASLEWLYTQIKDNRFDFSEPIKNDILKAYDDPSLQNGTEFTGHLFLFPEDWIHSKVWLEFMDDASGKIQRLPIDASFNYTGSVNNDRGRDFLKFLHYLNANHIIDVIEDAQDQPIEFIINNPDEFYRNYYEIYSYYGGGEFYHCKFMCEDPKDICTRRMSCLLGWNPINKNELVYGYQCMGDRQSKRRNLSASSQQRQSKKSLKQTPSMQSDSVSMYSDRHYAPRQVPTPFFQPQQSMGPSLPHPLSAPPAARSTLSGPSQWPRSRDELRNAFAQRLSASQI